MEIKRMRTINECIKMLRTADPDSAVTYNLIRHLATAGTVKSIKSGAKILVNYDDLLVQIFGESTGLVG